MKKIGSVQNVYEIKIILSLLDITMTKTSFIKNTFIKKNITRNYNDKKHTVSEIEGQSESTEKNLSFPQ